MIIIREIFIFFLFFFNIEAYEHYLYLQSQYNRRSYINEHWGNMGIAQHDALWAISCGQFTNASLLHLFHIMDIDLASLMRTLRTNLLSLASSLFIKLTIEWRIITLRFIILCVINILEADEYLGVFVSLRKMSLCTTLRRRMHSWL